MDDISARYTPGEGSPGEENAFISRHEIKQAVEKGSDCKKDKKITRLVRTSRVSGMGIGTGLEIPAKKTGSKSNDRGFDFKRWNKSRADDRFFAWAQRDSRGKENVAPTIV